VQGRGDPRYLGWVIVETKRHARWLADLTLDEAAAVGHGVPHFHLHVLARYPDTPSDLRWHEVDEWEGAPRGGADEIAATVDRIRAQLPY
jgi:diadenosine tetraphosphate (Ap4A) HIT family hydrolase